MVASENLAGREEFAPIVQYADRVAEHFALIRGRTVIPPKSREAVLGAHEALRVTAGVRKDLKLDEGDGIGMGNQEGEPDVSYIFHRTPASTVPLAKLEKVFLMSLKWCEEIKGHVLVIRTFVEPCFVEGALCAVVEDETGAVHSLRVYNALVKGRDERNILPLGAVLAIKEPYCEAATEATSGIRVDHPSDLVYLSESDLHFPDDWKTKGPKETRSESLKDEGNASFKTKSYQAAILKYTSALDYDPIASLRASILLNRAQAFLEIGCYSDAASDANQVNESSDTPNEKALFRCGRALYALGKYDEALTTMEKLLSSFPQNREAKALLTKSKARLEEQRYAKYEWSEVLSEARFGAPRLDVANHVGPIVQDDGGLYKAKTDIKAGELLMVSKAFTTLYPEDLKGERGALIYDSTQRVLGQAEGWKMTQAIASKISRDSSSINDISPLLKGTDVYGGETQSLGSMVDGRPVVDIHSLDAIREVHAIPFSTIHPLVPSMRQPVQGLGLWPLASRFHVKHSCLPNTFRTFIGDLLILRVCKNIKKGEYITLAHVNASIPLPERKAELTQPPGTPCDCAFCDLEAKEGMQMRQQRVDLVQRVKALSERAPPQSLRTDADRDQKSGPSNEVVRDVAKEVSKICDELEATYSEPAHLAPRFPLLEPLSYLFSCYLYLGPDSTEDALRANARYFGALGFEFDYTSTGDVKGGDVALVRHGLYHPYIVRTLVQQASVCWQLGKRRTANGWRNIAENAMEIVAGHRKLFKEGYAMVFESLKWEL